MKLRPYQENCIETVWTSLKKEGDVLVVLPTASGKTIIFTHFLKKSLDAMKFAGRELKSMVLVNQVKLITQTQEKLLTAMNESDVGLVCGTLKEDNADSAVTVASIDTIKKEDPFVHCLIIDEAHNADNAPKYLKFIQKLKDKNPNLKIVRFTATPFTASGGYIYGKGKPNERVAFSMKLSEMIDLGYIVRPRFHATEEEFDTSSLKKRKGDFMMKDLEILTRDDQKIKRQVEDALKRLGGRKKVVFACTTIEHAEKVHAFISEFEPATIIHSKLSRSEQLFNVEEFESGSVRHIVSVTMVSEGYDFPGIDAIVCMRPTRSPVLYVQLIGRGLRLFPGKEDCLFLDYGGVVEALGSPDEPLVKSGSKKQEAEKRVIICPSCRDYIFLPAKECRNCGHELPVPEGPKREHSKNLTDQAASIKLNLKLQRDFVTKVLGWDLDDSYVSKSGNKCLKVTYNCLTHTYTDYFKIGTFYHKEFLKEFEIYKRPPTKIRVVIEKGWPRVKKRFY